MKKVKVIELIFEVTRKCNMVCEHCLRGCMENVNMSKQIADETLKNVDSISQVVFTGGEPVLNVELITYIIDQIIKKEINIEGFYIVSNGKEQSLELAIALLKLYAYMGAGGNLDEDYSSFQVSIDEYHEEANLKNFAFYSGLKFFSLRKNDYSYGVIDMGFARENGLASEEYDISTPEIEYDENDEIESIQMVYINALGDILTDCNLSYEVQEEEKYGNILNNSIYETFMDWTELEEIA